MNNVVIAVALVIGGAWAWGSIGVMQRNYNLQKELDAKVRQQKLVELEMQTLALQQNYYKTSEYQELAVRARMGLANPGEKVLMLPANTPAAKAADTVAVNKPVSSLRPAGNFEQWMNFLFGGSRQR